MEPSGPPVHHPDMSRPLLTLALAACLIPASWVAPARAANDPPRLGNPADSILNRTQEYQLGQQVYRQLLESGQVMDDPIINAYLQDLGQRIVASADNDGTQFTFFAIDDGRINAFAVPGGFVGINRGMIEIASSESELASVIAHEVAHVLQRHIVRRAESVAQSNLATMLATIAGLVVAANSSNPDVTAGVIMASQSAQAQAQINYTREMEYDADRVGISYLSQAGFDPNAMAAMFDSVGQRTRLYQSAYPEYLATHPVTVSRVNEARSRARGLPQRRNVDSRSFALVKARAAVAATSDMEALLERYPETEANRQGWAADARSYGRALALADGQRADQAAELMARLLQRHQDVVAFHLGLAETQRAAGQRAQALVTLANANRLFPRNRPVTRAYFEALMGDGQAELAHDLLLDLLFNVDDPTPPEVRRLAQAAGDAGEVAEGHAYMAEYNLMIGRLDEALMQLTLALRSPDLDEYQEARFTARLEEIERYMPRRPRREIEDPADRRRSSPQG